MTKVVSAREVIFEVLDEALPDDEAKAAYIVVRLEKSLDSAGFVVVPIEPSEKMVEAGYYHAMAEDAKAVWESMLTASQE